jgi:epoxyqueuosine reductase QueG
MPPRTSRQRRKPAPPARVARTPSLHAGARLQQQILRQAKRLGASLVGVAPAGRWAEDGIVPEPYRPDRIWPEARSVITFAVPILLPIIDSTPSINYQEQYNTANRQLDDLGYRLSVWLNDHGHGSFFLPRDGYGSLEVLVQKPYAAFSHVMSAKYAGLGTIGLSHNLVTPEYGPRVRFGSVFTAAALPGTPLLTTDQCDGCRVCERLCPVGALRHREGSVVGDMDKEACTRHHITLRGEKHWPCGVCVKVCPIGADRRLFGSYGTKGYLDERGAIEADADDPRYAGLVHLRRHGSSGTRLA